MKNTNDYLRYLPSVLSQKNLETPQVQLGQFLCIFKDIFDDLDERIDDIPKLFDPWKTPTQFLSYLASWLALEWDSGWSDAKFRALIRRIVSLYKQRGTLKALEEYLQIYATDIGVTLEESPAGIADNANIFRVTINYPGYLEAELERRKRIVRAIVDREKPAHTYYILETKTPTLQIGVHSTIGVDTILGSD